MSAWINTPAVRSLLDALYADAAEADRRPDESGTTPTRPPAMGVTQELAHYARARHRYMAIGREFGRLLYATLRAANATTVVEFGTSFGVSTIYLASAVRDNAARTGRAGKVITTEFEPEKADRARKNLATAGLSEFVEIRVGDALQTLRADLPASIDALFLDGAKTLYLDVLKLLEPHFRSGTIIASDNTDHDGVETLLAYVRDPSNGYTSSAILTSDRTRPSGHEISLRD